MASSCKEMNLTYSHVIMTIEGEDANEANTRRSLQSSLPRRHEESSNDRRAGHRNQTGSSSRQGRTCRVGEERHLRIHGGKSQNRRRYRSEERRVGKECRSRWSTYQ